jgi:hypothetical protein
MEVFNIELGTDFTKQTVILRRSINKRLTTAPWLASTCFKVTILTHEYMIGIGQSYSGEWRKIHYFNTLTTSKNCRNF